MCRVCFILVNSPPHLPALPSLVSAPLHSPRTQIAVWEALISSEADTSVWGVELRAASSDRQVSLLDVLVSSTEEKGKEMPDYFSIFPPSSFTSLSFPPSLPLSSLSLSPPSLCPSIWPLLLPFKSADDIKCGHIYREDLKYVSSYRCRQIILFHGDQVPHSTEIRRNSFNWSSN